MFGDNNLPYWHAHLSRCSLLVHTASINQSLYQHTPVPNQQTTCYIRCKTRMSAFISIHTANKVCGEITYLFLNFNRATVEV